MAAMGSREHDPPLPEPAVLLAACAVDAAGIVLMCHPGIWVHTSSSSSTVVEDRDAWLGPASAGDLARTARFVFVPDQLLLGPHAGASKDDDGSRHPALARRMKAAGHRRAACLELECRRSRSRRCCRAVLPHMDRRGSGELSAGTGHSRGIQDLAGRQRSGDRWGLGTDGQFSDRGDRGSWRERVGPGRRAPDPPSRTGTAV